MDLDQSSTGRDNFQIHLILRKRLLQGWLRSKELTCRVEWRNQLCGVTIVVTVSGSCEHAAEQDEEDEAHKLICACSLHYHSVLHLVRRLVFRFGLERVNKDCDLQLPACLCPCSRCLLRTSLLYLLIKS